MSSFEIGLGLEKTHVVVTGASGQIGQRVVSAFLAAGAYVSGFDLNASRMTQRHERLEWYTVDVTDEIKLEHAFDGASERFGLVTSCCAVAGLDLSFIPHHESICDLPLDQWQRVINTNITGTFLTARSWLRGVREGADSATRNVSFVIFGSEAGEFGVPGNADYATSKAGIQYGLTRSLAPEAARIFPRARVNAVAPGPVDTPQFRDECAAADGIQYQEAEATVVLKRAVPIDAVARACLMLVSENYSSSVTGQTWRIDNGKSGRLLWQENGQTTW